VGTDSLGYKPSRICAIWAKADGIYTQKAILKLTLLFVYIVGPKSLVDNLRTSRRPTENELTFKCLNVCEYVFLGESNDE